MNKDIKQKNRGVLKNDRTGTKFGRLYVIERYSGDNKKGNWWLCNCDCGEKNVLIPFSGFQRKGRETQSCGCIQKEKAAKRFTTHGLSKTRIHKTWKSIQYRCYNKSCSQFADYGGRGIQVCEEWLKKDNGFLNFYLWSLNNGYDESNKDISIDRVNVNGNYEPGNCKWSTKKEQANNKRNTVYIEVDGIRKTASQWADTEGIQVTSKLIMERYRSGKRGEQLFKKPGGNNIV